MSSARAVLAVLVLLVCLLVGAVEATAAPPVRSLTDSQLSRESVRLDAEATRIGEHLLRADALHDEVSDQRDVARRVLAAFLAESYKRSSTSGTLAQQVLESGSIAEAADRLRIASTIGEYHGNMLRSLDAAQAAVQLGQVQRARLITQLTAAQRRLQVVVDEQSRRAALRAAHEAERARVAGIARAKAQEQAQAQARSASLLAAASAGQVPGMLVSSPVPFVPQGSPPTAAVLDAYLASKGSPMAGQGAAFMESAARWRVDPRLLVAIAGAESSFGQVTCGPNNAWGWACPNDPADFATWAAGIDTVTSGLRRYYLDEGRTSVSLIQQKYCPVGAANDPTGLNNHWATNVTKFLVELGGNPAMVGPGPSGASAIGLPGFGMFSAD